MNKAECTTMGTTAARPGSIASRDAGGVFGKLRRLPAAVFETLLTWQERASERHRLRQMDDRMLRDMGLSRADVEREASIPFWRVS